MNKDKCYGAKEKGSIYIINYKDKHKTKIKFEK